MLVKGDGVPSMELDVFCVETTIDVFCVETVNAKKFLLECWTKK